MPRFALIASKALAGGYGRPLDSVNTSLVYGNVQKPSAFLSARFNQASVIYITTSVTERPDTAVTVCNKQA
jgi:hypothetical protein